ncbi:MAG: hypothetical protein IJI12_01825 [Atopobiaceae bacterium]|nr:hypothetical protein [Atopobiaceae bacterium]
MQYESTDYYQAPSWLWDEVLSARQGELEYGRIVFNSGLGEIELLGRGPSRETIETIGSFVKVIGRLEQAGLFFHAFERDCRLLFSGFDLTKDGHVDVPKDRVEQLYHEFNGAFAAFLVSGHRLSRRLDDYAKSCFKNDGAKFEIWTGSRNRLYEESLAYALCDSLRNEVEHGFAVVNLVNYDVANCKAGFALNLEAGLLKRKKVSGAIKNRLKDFRDARLKNGLSPWLSIGSMAVEYRLVLYNLYCIYLAITNDWLNDWLLPDDAREEIGEADCIYWHIDPCDDKNYSCDRCYPIPWGLNMPSVAAEHSRVNSAITRINEFYRHPEALTDESDWRGFEQKLFDEYPYHHADTDIRRSLATFFKLYPDCLLVNKRTTLPDGTSCIVLEEREPGSTDGGGSFAVYLGAEEEDSFFGFGR